MASFSSNPSVKEFTLQSTVFFGNTVTEENMRFFVLPIIYGVIKERHPIFLVVDAGVPILRYNCVSFAFCHRDLLEKIHHFNLLVLNNYAE